MSIAALSFGFRTSGTESYDGNQSRFIPSSIYSGPGPEVEAPLQPVKPTHAQNGHGNGNGGWMDYQDPGGIQTSYTPKNRNSDALNVGDPVAMHLLTETALSDSKNYEVLSFDELELLKREKMVLRNRINATQRKLTLEGKLRDAAQSLNRLYDSGEQGHRRNMIGSKSSHGSNSSDVWSRTEDELAASNRKMDDLTHELKQLGLKLEDTQRRILEHTAGVLQLTHKGLKKNRRNAELPRSPESMASMGQHGTSRGLISHEFDERSLYPVPDYVNDFVATSPMTPLFPSKSKTVPDTRELDDIAHRLQELSVRMHDMVVRSSTAEETLQPPDSTDPDTAENVDSRVQAHLAYLSQSLDALNISQQRTIEESGNVNSRVRDMLEKTNSVSRSPLLAPDEFSRGDDIASQLAFSTKVLEQLHSRIETLINQKEILTRQIQQQRELNTKSDAQRDAQIHDLTEQLRETQHLHATSEEEAKQSQGQISQLIDQLDRARGDVQLQQQQRGMNQSNALQSERAARKEAEEKMLFELQSKQYAYTELEADLAKIQNDFEVQSQLRIQELNDLAKAKEESDIVARRHQSESEKLLEQIAGIQTELTMAKAELDGAYGSRAQRAADVSSNPAIQKQLDSLKERNIELQNGLKDTLEDYEQMTKASIDFEKERDTLEASIDNLRDKCETLESQLNEERLKQLGIKPPSSNETTSTTVLKHEFKKMMRETRTESIKALRAEQEERRRLELLIRQMKKEMGYGSSTKSHANVSAGPATPA